MMRLAQIISVIGHPLFMPLYAVGLMFRFNPYLSLQVPDVIQRLVFGVLIIFTLLLPSVTAFGLKKLGVIKSVYMRTAEERKWPFLFTLLWYYLGFELLTELTLPLSLYLLMIGAISVILVAHFITIRWKISVHMIGIGGVIGAMAGISYRFQYDHFYLITALIFIAGLIGFARLKTESHNYRQVYAGFFLGFIVEWLAVSLF
ncbi:MAG: hypothetical protein H8D62_03195 [Bacteroidetes bacterium]|nr:hypothetical protein [Bacteroidota bacterium]